MTQATSETQPPWTERVAVRSLAELTGRMLRSLSTWAWALHLSAEGFGVLSHAWAVNLLLAQAFSLALPTLLLREATARPEAARSLYRHATRARLLLLVPELVVFAALATVLPLRPLAPYVWLLVAVTLSALQDLAGHLLMAKGLWRGEARVTLASGVLVAATSALAMALGGGVVAATASVVLGNAVGAALALLTIRRSIAPDVAQAASEAATPALAWRTVAPWAAFMLLEQLIYHLETVWLGAAASHTAVAHFSAVYRVLGLSGPLVLVASQLLLPHATRLADPGTQTRALAALARRGLVVGTATGLVGALALAATLPRLLPLVVPFADAETARVAHRLSFLLVFWFANTPLVQVALGAGRERALLAWALCTLLVQVGLCAWLIPTGGAVGAASAKLATSALSTVALALLVRRQLGTRAGLEPERGAQR